MKEKLRKYLATKYPNESETEIEDTIKGILEWSITRETPKEEGVHTIMMYGYPEEEAERIYEILTE